MKSNPVFDLVPMRTAASFASSLLAIAIICFCAVNPVVHAQSSSPTAPTPGAPNKSAMDTTHTAQALIQTKVVASASKDITAFKQEFLRAWKRSEDYTLTVFEQMPEQHLNFKYTPESFSFRFQFVHCIIFTANQVAARLDIPFPYESRKRDYWDKCTKAEISKELRGFYAWVANVVQEASAEKLLEEEKFAGDTIAKWQLMMALENHIIHHRGQAIVYLRLKGVTPVGYVGW